MVIKSNIFIECNTKKFDCWNFRMDLFSNFYVECVFLVGDYHMWSFTRLWCHYAGAYLFECSWVRLSAELAEPQTFSWSLSWHNWKPIGMFIYSHYDQILSVNSRYNQLISDLIQIYILLFYFMHVVGSDSLEMKCFWRY